MSPELGFPGDPGRLIRDGLLIEVHIGHAQKREAPGRHLHPQRALIDTGASDCCVDIDLAEQLQLKKVDRDAVTGVTGERLIVDVYSARIRIEALDITLLDPCPGYPLRKMGSPFRIILGRSFLYRVTMSYDGSSGRGPDRSNAPGERRAEALPPGQTVTTTRRLRPGPAHAGPGAGKPHIPETRPAMR